MIKAELEIENLQSAAVQKLDKNLATIKKLSEENTGIVKNMEIYESILEGMK